MRAPRGDAAEEDSNEVDFHPAPWYGANPFLHPRGTQSMIAHKRRLFGSTSLVAVLTLALGAHARADSVAVTITPDPASTFNNGFGYSLGYEFLANSNVTVTQLGYFVDTTLTESHEVGLYTDTGTLLASTTIVNGDVMVANFAYNPITAVTLTAGQDYVIMGTSGFTDPYTFNPTSFSTDPSISFVQSAYNFDAGSGLNFPDTFDPTVTGYFGPNFMIVSSSIPEPSTLTLGGLAMVGGLLVSWRRRLSRTV
jgi:hypothetical protein